MTGDNKPSVTNISQNTGTSSTTSSPSLQPNVSNPLENLHLIADKRGTLIGLSHYLAVFLWLGWIGSYFLLLGLIIVLYIYYVKSCVAFLGFLVLITFIPIDRSTEPKWGFAIGAWVMRKAQEYFAVRLYFEDKDLQVEAKSPAIFFLEPHDVLPVGIFVFQDFLGYFKGHMMLGAVSGSLFKSPFMRHTYTWANGTSVEKDNLQKVIKKGHSIVVCPGGAREAMYLQNNNEYTLFIKNRYGLVRLAMEFGTPIYPTFTFGLRKMYPVWAPKSRFIKRWGSFLGYVPLFFLGIFNIPFAQPKPTPLTIVVGKPVFVDKVTDPAVLEQIQSRKLDKIDPEVQQKIKDYHEKIVESIRRIFETYKSEFDMGEVTLKIIGGGEVEK